METLQKTLVLLSKNSKREVSAQVKLAYNVILAVLFIGIGAGAYLLDSALTTTVLLKASLPAFIIGYCVHVLLQVIKNGKKAKESAISQLMN
ncbi:hypothetical protein [uncultured Pseudoalteromonas sp.]|uniref:hypothetical protein n=1 Tax=uncultured Pseudoalteromonas sp. TaxID=114053 RepID=UPI002592CC61|nr:hypothetical protein [uncultured Pseudoalteromonas sp.]